jgi:hypothetical protein
MALYEAGIEFVGACSAGDSIPAAISASLASCLTSYMISRQVKMTDLNEANKAVTKLTGEKVILQTEKAAEAALKIKAEQEVVKRDKVIEEKNALITELYASNQALRLCLAIALSVEV